MSDLTNAEKREIWMECHNWEMSVSRDEIYYKLAQEEALRRYPDPYEPRIVTDENGWQYRINPETGKTQIRFSVTGPWDTFTSNSAATLIKLGEIAQEYSERTK